MERISHDELLILKNNMVFSQYDMSKLHTFFININFSIRKFVDKADILVFDNEFKGVMILLEGSIHTHMLFENGKFFLIDTVNPGDIFGISFFLSETKNNFCINFIAEKPSKILFIQQNEFLELLLEQKHMLENFLCLYNTKLQLLCNKIAILSFSNNKLRIAQYLLNKIDKNKNNVIELSSTKKYISQYLCISRSSFYRELNALIKEKAVFLKKGNILICDEGKLKTMVDF